ATMVSSEQEYMSCLLSLSGFRRHRNTAIVFDSRPECRFALGGTPMQRLTCWVLGTFLIVVALSQSAWSQTGEKWVVSWAASAHGPYPVGNASAQPDQRFAFPDPAAGARDQTLRLIVRPSIWGQQMRIRLSNVFGTRPVSFDGIHVGLQL